MVFEYSDYLGLFVYLLLMLFVVILTRRTPKFLDFALASRRIPYFLIFASLASTYIGPGFSIGAADKAQATGYFNFLLFLPFALQTLLVGLFLAPRLAKLEGCYSIGDVIGRHSNIFGHILAGISSVAICVLFAAFLAKVAGDLLNKSIGLPFAFGVIAVSVLSVSYTLFGGIRASIITDAIQFTIFTLVIPLVVIFAIFKTEFSFIRASEIAISSTQTAWQESTTMSMVAIALSFLLGETLIPPYANRALASKSPLASRKSFVLGAIFCVFWLLLVTGIGIIAPQLNTEGNEKYGSLLSVAIYVLPHGLLGFFLVAIIGILMSSQDSVLNAGAVAFTRDIIAPIFRIKKQKFTDESQMIIGRIATIIIAVLGALIAGWLPSIIEALLLIYSIWAPTVMIPLVLGLLIKEPGRHSAWLAICFGGGLTILWDKVFGKPYGVESIIPGVLAGLFGFLIGFLVHKVECRKQKGI